MKIRKNIFTLICGCISVMSFGQCQYILTMYDTSGDGWNGNSMTIQTSGYPATTGLTVAFGSGQSYLLTITPGDTLNFNWQGGGSKQNECYYTVAEASPYNLLYTSPTGDQMSINTPEFEVFCCNAVNNLSFSYNNSGSQFSFVASQNGASSYYRWDFGDGNFGSGATVSHTYTSSGTFDVSLESLNNCGDTLNITIPIIFCLDSILANWTATLISSGPLGMKIEFNANVSLGASSYKWFFGDGDSGVGKVVTHIYDTPGLFYNVTLITSNNCAGSASITKSLTTIGTIEKEISPLKIWPTTLMPGQKIYLTNNNSAEPRNKIKIFDSNGRLMNGHNISDGIEIPYHWPIGSYILSIDHHIYKFILTQ